MRRPSYFDVGRAAIILISCTVFNRKDMHNPAVVTIVSRTGGLEYGAEGKRERSPTKIAAQDITLRLRLVPRSVN